MKSTGPRTTLVTGAGSGMGASVTRLLRARGETVIGADLKNANLACELSSDAGREALVSTLRERSERLDAVIACAGVAIGVPSELLVSVNYFGVVALLERLQPLLASGHQPRAVAISSSATLLEHDAEVVRLCLCGDEAAALQRAAEVPDIAYASSKRALSQWIRRSAIQPQWAGAGILLNGVAPGAVKTPMTASLLDSAEARAHLARSAPTVLPDFLVADDIAPLLAFLASADNRAMVGQIPFADGGADILLRGETAL